MQGMALKEDVRTFWNRASCGEELYLPSQEAAGFDEHRRKRYELEPYIPGFARFDDTRGRKVLEIGVGLGADHEGFAAAGADLHGVDLTDRAIEMTTRRLAHKGLKSTLRVGDAEHLPFGDGEFDVVYSWGVIHHSPDTPAAVREIHRVLKPGGEARVMIYHTWSLVGMMLWARYGLLRGKPGTSMAQIYASHLESPGTKAYTPAEARELFRDFSNVETSVVLSQGDLLEGGAGQRHRGPLLSTAKAIFPRWLVRRAAPGLGLFLLITARK
jgi:SAM-dependent methyltransferase